MRWLDLFSGIGMYALGLEQAGHEVIGFCEREEFCKKVLKKHWPTKPISSCIISLNKALMELSGDSHVPTSAQQGWTDVPDFPDSFQDSSGRWCEPFAWYDLNTGSWRTWQRSLITGWETFSEKWPDAGIVVNGIAFQRPPLAHPTIAPEHTYLRTMISSEGNGICRNRFRGNKTSASGGLTAHLRSCHSDPISTNPNFAEKLLGLEKDYTLLETETRPASSEN